MQAAQLVIWRRTNKLSRPEAARLFGKSEKSVQRYEKGESPIPDDVAAVVMATPNVSAPGVEIAPPYTTGETPWTHPRLFRKAPGKKLRWDRIQPGEPLVPKDDHGLYPTAMDELEAAHEPED